jgi:hypothetical protein
VGEFYVPFFDECRIQCLQRALVQFCSSYARVEVSYVATSLKCKRDEVYDGIQDLILTGQLKGLIDADTGVLNMTPRIQVSPFTGPVERLFAPMEKRLVEMRRLILG